jgi:hypothetical protein
MPGIGFLGELDVIEYLTKNKGMEVYIPMKDKGIDLLCTGKNSFFKIQVKTSTFQKGSYFWFDLHEHKLIFSKNTYYIFVCKLYGRRQFMQKSMNMLVIPSLKLKKWVETGRIARKKSNADIFNIFVYPYEKERRWVYRNKGKEIDWTSYWNNFNFLD